MEIFRSERLYLRELIEADITDEYLSWFKNDTVTSFLQAKNLTKDAVLEHLNHGRNTGTHFMYAICDNQNDKHIGNVKVGPIDLKHSVSDLVTVIGDTNYWGKGLGAEIIQLGNKVAFENHNIRKLSGGMYAENVGSIKAYTRAGWVIEGRLLAHFVHEKDGPSDKVLVSCFNPKYFQQDSNGIWEVKK